MDQGRAFFEGMAGPLSLPYFPGRAVGSLTRNHAVEKAMTVHRFEPFHSGFVISGARTSRELVKGCKGILAEEWRYVEDVYDTLDGLGGEWNALRINASGILILMPFFQRESFWKKEGHVFPQKFIAICLMDLAVFVSMDKGSEFVFNMSFEYMKALNQEGLSRFRAYVLARIILR